MFFLFTRRAFPLTSRLPAETKFPRLGNSSLLYYLAPRPESEDFDVDACVGEVEVFIVEAGVIPKDGMVSQRQSGTGRAQGTSKV